METLDLLFAELGDDDLIALAKCVRNVDSLTIRGFHINCAPTKGIQAISNEILKRDNPVSAKYSKI